MAAAGEPVAMAEVPVAPAQPAGPAGTAGSAAAAPAHRVPPASDCAYLPNCGSAVAHGTRQASPKLKPCSVMPSAAFIRARMFSKPI